MSGMYLGMMGQLGIHGVGNLEIPDAIWFVSWKRIYIIFFIFKQHGDVGTLSTHISFSIRTLHLSSLLQNR